jgi:hypothetical protein
MRLKRLLNPLDKILLLESLEPSFAIELEHFCRGRWGPRLHLNIIIKKSNIKDKR